MAHTLDQYVMLIWEEIPENIRVYLIPTVELSANHYMLLDEAHGHYVNGEKDWDKNDGLAFLNMALCDPTERDANAHEKFVDQIGCFRKHLRHDKEKPIVDRAGAESLVGFEGVHLARVYVSGFYL